MIRILQTSQGDYFIKMSRKWKKLKALTQKLKTQTGSYNVNRAQLKQTWKSIN